MIDYVYNIPCCQNRMGVTKGCDDEVVISGMSGRFPESDTVHELWENLNNKVDMISIDGRFLEYNNF